jgi:hypothetical protein
VALPVARPLLQHRLGPRGAVAVHRSPDVGRDEARWGCGLRTGSARLFESSGRSLVFHMLSPPLFL